eukprot:GFUD01139457.1.p1 GENE.GFUD01139457.1~~GFUD01139457.1.p1  ORF type:complete len:660 (-),score=170.95 GFUD01139457.1:362-2341(-)
MEAKQRKPSLCWKCRIHGQQHLYKGGHIRLCLYRECPCKQCRTYEEGKAKMSDIRAHVQNLEGDTPQLEKTEVKYEINVKLEVKKEPEEYYSSDDANGDDIGNASGDGIGDASGDGIGSESYAQSADLGISQDDDNITQGLILNQSSGLDLSDMDASQNLSNDQAHTQNTPSGLGSRVLNFTSEKSNSIKACPYCEIIPGQSVEVHLKVCTTAREFAFKEISEDVVDKCLESDTNEAEALTQLVPLFESDPRDTETLAELVPPPTNPEQLQAHSIGNMEDKDPIVHTSKVSVIKSTPTTCKSSTKISPTPSTSSSIRSVAFSSEDVNTECPPFLLQCPICLADFSQSSPQKLEAHADSCQDFYSAENVRTCFMCVQEFPSTFPQIEYENHVQGHFMEEGLPPNQDSKTGNHSGLYGNQDKKRKSEVGFTSSKKIHLKDSLNSSFKSSLISQENLQTNASKLSSVKVEKNTQVYTTEGSPDTFYQTSTSSHQYSGNIKQSPGSGSNQTQFSRQSTQPKQFMGSNQRISSQSTQPNQPPGSSQTQSPVTFPESSQPQAPHIRGLVARFDQNCSKPEVKQISVSAGVVGLIIGEKGWFKRKVFEDTGVTINADRRTPQNCGSVTVTLIGPSVDLAKAMAMIEVKLGSRCNGWIINQPHMQMQ